MATSLGEFGQFCFRSTRFWPCAEPRQSLISGLSDRHYLNDNPGVGQIPANPYKDSVADETSHQIAFWDRPLKSLENGILRGFPDEIINNSLGSNVDSERESRIMKVLNDSEGLAF